MEEQAKKDLNEAKEKVKEFLKLEKQENNVYYLENFNFATLWDKGYEYRKFRAAKDEDSLWLAKYIYFILWHDKLPRMSTLGEMNDNYGGETINTYSTLLGGYDTKYKDLFNASEKEKIKEFEKTYLTIGNFMLLPKCRIKGNSATLNQLKKSCCQDYFDLFLKKLFLDNDNNIIFQLGKESELKEKDFCETFFLEAYFKDGKPIENYFEHNKKEDYKNFVLRYINKSTEIIKSRAETICKTLDEELFKKK